MSVGSKEVANIPAGYLVIFDYETTTFPPSIPIAGLPLRGKGRSVEKSHLIILDFEYSKLMATGTLFGYIHW